MLTKICSLTTTGTELWFVAVLLFFPVLSHRLLVHGCLSLQCEVAKTRSSKGKEEITCLYSSQKKRNNAEGVEHETSYGEVNCSTSCWEQLWLNIRRPGWKSKMSDIICAKCAYNMDILEWVQVTAIYIRNCLSKLYIITTVGLFVIR